MGNNSDMEVQSYLMILLKEKNLLKSSPNSEKFSGWQLSVCKSWPICKSQKWRLSNGNIGTTC